MPKKDVSIARYFADLTDPRVDRTKKHSLCDILVIALCAVVCGADSWEKEEAFGEAKAGWLRRFLRLPHDFPSHDTFYRVFARLDPQKFGKYVAHWMGAVCGAAARRHRLEGGPVGPREHVQRVPAPGQYVGGPRTD